MKTTARKMNISVSSFIRTTVAKEFQAKKQLANSLDLTGFAGLWEDNDIDQKTLREKAWVHN